MAAARSDEERAGITRQLDAFHKTFNFCMTCRQYTCANCWNEKVGECLTCAPDLTRDVLPALFPDLPPGGPTGATVLLDDAAMASCHRVADRRPGASRGKRRGRYARRWRARRGTGRPGPARRLRGQAGRRRSR